ncbi:MAG TPA: YebC/PmpR family DNA-binding transcriptional regulator [Candidatus Methylacidiphilales bacterium]|nr:YebC/PmpR family DNA-binding transcriptional regulator [Candidatus Methylacidiphilales bacterium]
MSGHSRWSKVKHYKGAIDQKRGKLFSKLSKEISVAAKMGGGDPNFNPRLRQAILSARGESMPVDNIERAIKKGTGEIEGVAYEEISYEGYGPGGIAILVEAATDNKNRTAQEIRSVFTKNHGHLAGSGSVAWMFHRKGVITITASGISEDDVMLLALDAGAEDIRTQDGVIEVITPPDNKLEAVSKALEQTKIPVASAKLSYIPGNLTPVTDLQVAEQVLALLEALDDHDDVQAVHANFEMASGLLAENGQ